MKQGKGLKSVRKSTEVVDASVKMKVGNRARVKALLFFLFFCLCMFVTMAIASYLWLEGLQADMDGMISFENDE